MVVFVDFESEDDDPYCHSSPHISRPALERPRGLSQSQNQCGLTQEEPIPQKRASTDCNGQLFGSALACYPVSLSIASQLDLNDLYALSFTCRRIHEGLSQFARQLRTKSLRCINDVPRRTSEEEVDAVIFREALDEIQGSRLNITMAPAYPLPFHANLSHSYMSLHSSTRVSKCARDLVAPCRKCGTTICRNCAAKPPSDRCLPNRHRRLCSTCLDAPMIDHFHPLRDNDEFHDTPPVSSASSTRSTRSESSSTSSQSDHESVEHSSDTNSFTSPTFFRQPCDCATRGVYLCQPCGQSLTSADTTYKRVWTWRSRYSTHIGGGLGTGLGLGNQGQKCGRGEYCLERGAGGVCWVEIDCSEARAQNIGREDGYGISRSSTPLASDHEVEGPTRNRPGYLSQELEGIGGVLKKKVKKRIKVGATVYEYDDERATGKYLVREASGKQRSWCGWCSRVSPGEKDTVDVAQLLNLHA